MLYFLRFQIAAIWIKHAVIRIHCATWLELRSLLTMQRGRNACKLKIGVANSMCAIRIKRSLIVELRENLVNRIGFALWIENAAICFLQTRFNSWGFSAICEGRTSTKVIFESHHLKYAMNNRAFIQRTFGRASSTIMNLWTCYKAWRTPKNTLSKIGRK